MPRLLPAAFHISYSVIIFTVAAFCEGEERLITTPLQWADTTASLCRIASSWRMKVRVGPSTASSAFCQSRGIEAATCTGGTLSGDSSCKWGRGRQNGQSASSRGG